MCGIAGVLARRPAPELFAIARRMNDSLRHRGPDMSGEWTDPDAGIALAHRRLSIVDLSPEGKQPMTSAGGRYVVSFNGEIYNHQAIREDLVARGHQFRGRSDTEVLLAAIEQYGVVEAIRASAGMFAFALWDRDRRELHLLRDRLGKKPLYYGWCGGHFVFASELKAIMAVPGFDLEIERAALASYMRHQYVPAPMSILRGLHMLPAGTQLVATLDGSGEPCPYWSIDEIARQGAQCPVAGSENSILDAIDDRLRLAVRERIVADVPVGAFLSGGIDSSLVSAMMQRESQRPIKTFTIGFEEPEFDESEHAAAVASAIGSEHHMLRLSADTFLSTIERLPEIHDEPFADPSAIPLYHIARYARERVTVCLSGDGGDELFGGYGRYQIAARLGRGIRMFPPWLRNMMADGIDTISPAVWDRLFRYLPMSAGNGLRGDLSGDRVHKLAALFRSRDADALYAMLTSVHEQPERLVLGSRETVAPSEPLLADGLRQMMLVDTKRYLPDDILVKLDRVTMAVGLEARAPLLDHRLVEYSWRLPSDMLLRNGRGKWPLHELFRRYLPAELADRPKRGFSVPIAIWLRGPLRRWAEQLIDPERLRADGLLAVAPVSKMWAEHISGERNWASQLWTILMFQSWKLHWQKAITSADSPSVAA